MLCAVYKSPKKQQTYLFIEKRDDFAKVPQVLLDTFGAPQLVTMINLATKEKLGFADLAKVKASLNEQGFYLQIPPPVENLLEGHKAQMQQLKGTDND
ncbi:YcgL domain-containing protein [Thalassotalea agarivorans]|uniref:YcgL domain-containing protein SAMN05660429_00986 n=1 Tax=Thalassotalea agarivorans TaxID=349064 RepID=A0A1I0BN10_THASX|nr:YcgL domain-containing protein [Thalassotalea agarivorans]SET07677.1 hypothetical protein SAMN05660429_00986 [Thalassotalea agarivorans]